MNSEVVLVPTLMGSKMHNLTSYATKEQPARSTKYEMQCYF